MDYLITSDRVSILDIPNEPDVLLSSEDLDLLVNDKSSRDAILAAFDKASIIVECIGEKIAEGEFKKLDSVYTVANRN